MNQVVFEQFLEKLGETRKKYRWYITDNGRIRAHKKKNLINLWNGSYYDIFCPLTVITKHQSVGNFSEVGKKLGFKYKESLEIIKSADAQLDSNTKIRKQILKATGLAGK